MKRSGWPWTRLFRVWPWTRLFRVFDVLSWNSGNEGGRGCRGGTEGYWGRGWQGPPRRRLCLLSTSIRNNIDNSCKPTGVVHTAIDTLLLSLIIIINIINLDTVSEIVIIRISISRVLQYSRLGYVMHNILLISTPIAVSSCYCY
jgi:hypothetical protein